MLEQKESIRCIDDVRTMSCEILNRSQDLIEIDYKKLDEVLMPRIETYVENKKENSWLPEGSNLPIEQEVGLNLFFNVINFCYKDLKTGNEYVFKKCNGKETSRSAGLLAALAESGIDWNDFEAVSKITPEKWLEMTQISESNPMYLGAERRDKITGFAKKLLESECVNMPDFLDECDFDASRMAFILSESGYFDDCFMKRAQLTSRMINDVLARRKADTLCGMEKLTVMADYRIPQAFYNLGTVNIVNMELLGKLINQSPILSESREEKALRATAVFIGKIVAAKLGITEADVDMILWGLSQDMVKKGEMLIPHMLVATDAY
jgi:hypothetical protein